MKFKVTILPPWKRLKKYLIAILVITLIKIPWVWIAREDGSAVLSGATLSDILSRRRYLIGKVHTQVMGTSQMPIHLGSQFKGEWAVGTYSMLAAALTNIVFLSPETRLESLAVVDDLIERLLKPELKEFDIDRWAEDPLDTLDNNKGHIGYLGHLNWMLSAHYFLGGDMRYDARFRDVSEALVRKLRASPRLCLETYPDEYYVMDNVVVIASIANFSKLHNGRLADLATDWVQNASRTLLHKELGLLPFHLDEHCNGMEVVRGSGIGWNSYYLPFIDQDFAADQYEKLKKHLLQTRLITGIREYPRGTFGVGDVDSGPVLLGFSPSGTGFSIGGTVHAGDSELLTKLLLTSEIVGSTIGENERRYLFAPLVGDAIMLAMKTARVWDSRFVRVQ